MPSRTCKQGRCGDSVVAVGAEDEVRCAEGEGHLTVCASTLDGGRPDPTIDVMFLAVGPIDITLRAVILHDEVLTINGNVHFGAWSKPRLRRRACDWVRKRAHTAGSLVQNRV